MSYPWWGDDKSLILRYMRLCGAILWVEFMFRIPFFIQQLSTWADIGKTSNPTTYIDKKFVLHVVVIIFPELKLFLVPLATLLLLPGPRQDLKKRFIMLFNFIRNGWIPFRCSESDGSNYQIVESIISHEPESGSVEFHRDEEETDTFIVSPSVTPRPETPAVVKLTRRGYLKSKVPDGNENYLIQNWRQTKSIADDFNWRPIRLSG